PLEVRKLRRGESLAGVHLVYIARSEEARLAETLAAAKGQPVLVVTESKQATAPGGMINFVVVDAKVRFDIAPQAAELSGLRISARLLGVARTLIARTP
ncbi:MAG TPA: YfiR family protein, partial [Albitalea sp.]|nr:YfiR family protein [Albitalea sp.]